MLQRVFPIKHLAVHVSGSVSSVILQSN